MILVGHAGETIHRTHTLLKSAQSQLQGRSILWVDDRPENNAYESSLLQKFGIQIHAVRTTQEALAFLAGRSCDLVISDVDRVEQGAQRPNAGYDLLDASQGAGQRVPVIFYTGDVAKINTERALKAFGAADDVGDLVDLIVRALSGR